MNRSFSLPLKSVFFLIALVALCAVCLTACDDAPSPSEPPITNVTPGDDTHSAETVFLYELNFTGDGYIVMGCMDSPKGTLSIPATYKNLPVVAINDLAFCGYSGLTSVDIPDSVTSIGAGAFSDCDGLTAVHITDLAAWCQIDFRDNPLSYAEHLYLNGTEPSGEFVIPDGVTSIGKHAFFNCSGLTSVTIPDSVTSIGDSAFSGCTGLIQIEGGVSYVDKWVIDCDTTVTSVTLRADTVGIGYRAFYDCTGLTSITIPDSVTSIGRYAFEGCSGLTAVHITDLAAWCRIDFQIEFDSYYDLYRANPLYYAKHLYLNGSELSGDLVIPDGVTTIGAGAFYSCSGLTSVTIPDSIVSIGDNAFYNCFVTAIHISDLAAWCQIDIPISAFSGEYSGIPAYYSRSLYLNGTEVKDLVIPDGVTTIGAGAFQGCSGLTSVTIPDSVTSIGDDAFLHCFYLTSISFGKGITHIGDRSFQACFNLTDVHITDLAAWCQIDFNDRPLSCAEHLYLNGTEVKNLVIPDGVTSIGYAFSDCNGLTSVIIPDSVTSIGDYAFSGCIGLTSVIIPDSVTSIGDYAFSGCTGLTSVTIGKGVVIIGRDAFEGCTGLTSVIIPDNVTSIEDSAFSGCTGLTSVTIGKRVAIIYEYAFEGCTGLTSVTIGEGVFLIGEYAFEGCSGLTSVTIGEGVFFIGEYAFEDCTSLTSIAFADTSTWYCVDSELDLSNPATNATYLTTRYCNCYWQKK